MGGCGGVRGGRDEEEEENDGAEGEEGELAEGKAVRGEGEPERAEVEEVVVAVGRSGRWAGQHDGAHWHLLRRLLGCVNHALRNVCFLWKNVRNMFSDIFVGFSYIPS